MAGLDSRHRRCLSPHDKHHDGSLHDSLPTMYLACRTRSFKSHTNSSHPLPFSPASKNRTSKPPTDNLIEGENFPRPQLRRNERQKEGRLSSSKRAHPGKTAGTDTASLLRYSILLFLVRHPLGRCFPNSIPHRELPDGQGL